MIYYRIEWGEYDEDFFYNTVYRACDVCNLNFPKEKSVDQLTQIVYQKICNDKSDYRTVDNYSIEDLVIGEILKSNSPIEDITNNNKSACEELARK